MIGVVAGEHFSTIWCSSFFLLHLVISSFFWVNVKSTSLSLPLFLTFILIENNKKKQHRTYIHLHEVTKWLLCCCCCCCYCCWTFFCNKILMWKFPPPQSLSLSSSHVYIPLLAMFFFLNFYFINLFVLLYFLAPSFLAPFLAVPKVYGNQKHLVSFFHFRIYFFCSSTLFALYKICIVHIKKSKMKKKKKRKAK